MKEKVTQIFRYGVDIRLPLRKLPDIIISAKERTLIDTHPNEDFYVMNGNRALIKREKFERYLDQATAV